MNTVMKKIKKILNAFLFVLSLSLGFISCTDYLDKSPEAGMSEDDIFKSFDKYQGFIEDGMDCMVDPSRTFTINIFNFGDDLLNTTLNYLSPITGDYRGWEKSEECIFYGRGSGLFGSDIKWNITPVGYWHGGWMGIRKANIALANLDKMTVPYKDAPLQEQKDLIEGQARFLRGYFHFHIIRAWGGMPYITKIFTPTDKLDYPRLSYAASSDSIEKDLLIAAKKLPVNWDDTQTGKITLGTNAGRFTKGAAYALLGKVMLYAGSPLMNGSSTGNYTYNKEYCKKAVKYFWEVLKLSAIGGGSTYDLLPWSNYSDNFFVKNGTIPGTGKEGVLNHFLVQNMNYKIGDEFDTMGGWGHAGCGPTENYVEYFGMEDGTNFDPAIYNTPSTNPFANRDPRFYKNIIYDGDLLYKGVIAQFYLGGVDRGGPGKSQSGYGWRKFRDNSLHGGTVNWSAVNQNLPIIRLGDVYLMYAEALNEAYGCNIEPASVDPELSDCHITAVQIVKAVRARVLRTDNTPLPLPESFFADDNALRETIRRERAVELAFESHRWYDLRRWYVGDLPEYKRMDMLDMDVNHTYFKVRSYATKAFEKKHFWLPILDAQIQISNSWKQNPGW